MRSTSAPQAVRRRRSAVTRNSWPHFASSTEQAQSYLAALSDERASATWRLMAGGRELFAAPRAAVLRSFLFNHWYHHRGQLLVYLRLLNVPVPSVYGPTADENPFADA